MRVFVSYRRNDTEYIAGRLYDRLVSNLGPKNVFKDVDSIPLGADFRNEMEQQLVNCDVVLVLIGETWLTCTDANGNRRIQLADDYVRIEVETALANRKKIVPLLFKTEMPNAESLPSSLASLAFLNAMQIRPDPDFERDVERLFKALGIETGENAEQNSRLSLVFKSNFSGCAISIAVVMSLFAMLFLLITPRGDDFLIESLPPDSELQNDRGAMQRAIDKAIRIEVEALERREKSRQMPASDEAKDGR